MAESAPVLRLQGVTKTYHGGNDAEVEVLRGIDFELQRGELVALIGPSGSGKTTLLNLAGLLERPSGGQIFLNDRETGAYNDQELNRLRGHYIGFVYQYHYLLPTFAALKDAMTPVLADPVSFDREINDRAHELLSEMGMPNWSDHLSITLSRRGSPRVAIARAPGMNPALVLADEPTGHLDTDAAVTVFDMMREVNAEHGTSFLIVTHNKEIARRCDRRVEVIEGRLRKAA